MEPERIELRTQERERLKVSQQVEDGHLRQRSGPQAACNQAAGATFTGTAARRRRWRDRASIARPALESKDPQSLTQRAVGQLRQARYAGFGPTLAAEHLARGGIVVRRETLRKWMSAAGLWQPRRRGG
jgi:hypothetical protein